VDGKGEFDENILALGNNLKIEYEQFFEAYNEGQCVMVSIKNVTTPSKRYWYLKTQCYTILTKVVDEVN